MGLVPKRPVVLEIDYTNHRGERRWRRISPIALKFVTNEFHGPDPHYMLLAADLDKNAIRSFLFTNIHGSREVPRERVWFYEI